MPSTNQYIVSSNLNIRNSNKELVAVISPEKYESSYGQLILSACIADEYLEKTVLVINSKPKPSTELESGYSHTAGGLLCDETEYIELGKALKHYGAKSNEKP